MSAESQFNVLAHVGARCYGNRCDVIDCRLCWKDAHIEDARRAEETHDVNDTPTEYTLDPDFEMPTTTSPPTQATTPPRRVRVHELSEDQAAKLRAASDPTLRWFVPRWKWEVKLTWTNWTFGAWWGKIGRKYMIGIDVGPLEIVRTRSFVRSERAKHRPRR